MKFYNNIFASAYKYYSRFSSQDPLFSAVCFVALCQMVLLLLLFTLLKVTVEINLVAVFPNKYYFIPVFPLWVFIIYKYYSKAKVDSVIKSLNEKTPERRKMWGVVTIISMILPIVIIALLLTK